MIIHPSGGFDNHAQDNQHIEVRPLASAMGAEIAGVVISDLSDAQFAEIRNALFRHKMIYFRNQNVTRPEQAAFSLRFGPFAEDAYTEGAQEHASVQPLVKEADAATGMVFGAGWHTDSPFLTEPPAISMLYAVDVPPYGGDTIWANAALAFATLSDTMKQMLTPLKIHMSIARVLGSAQMYARRDRSPLGRLAAMGGMSELPPDVARKVQGAVHPLVRTHPVTRERSLYCDETYSAGIEGLREAEAEPLLKFLVAHITQPAFTCRLRWEAGTLALWDNRLCIHQAFNDYDGYRRELYRTTIAGETPR